MHYITEISLQRLKDEVQQLNQERAKVVIELDEARSQGDLSENAGYHAAKAKLREIDRKTSEIKAKLSQSSLINPTNTTVVQIGSYVKVKEENSGQEIVFRIIGEDDMDLLEDGVTLITYKSPVAKALMQKERGQDAEVNLPGGGRVYIILDIGVRKF